MQPHEQARLELLGLREASQLTTLSESYLRRHTVGGQAPTIPYRKLAGRIKFTVSDLEDVIAVQPHSKDWPGEPALRAEIDAAKRGDVSEEDRAFLDAAFARLKERREAAAAPAKE